MMSSFGTAAHKVWVHKTHRPHLRYHIEEICARVSTLKHLFQEK